MNKDSKIYVAGHNGMVGSAIWRSLLNHGYTNLVGVGHSSMDLTNQLEVNKFFKVQLSKLFPTNKEKFPFFPSVKKERFIKVLLYILPNQLLQSM